MGHTLDGADTLALILSLIPTLLLAVLFVFGVVRSGGVPRILLAIWVLLSTVTSVLNIVGAALAWHMSYPGFGAAVSVTGFVSSILLAVALIIGRPGYRGAPPAYGAPMNHPGPPPYGQPYGPQGRP